MTELNSISPEKKGIPSQDETIQLAALIGLSNALGGLVFLGIGIYLALQYAGTWQAYTFLALVVVGISGALAGAAFVRRERMTVGGWLILVATLIATAFTSLLFVSIGYVAVAYILVTSFFNIRYAMPRKVQRPALVVALIALVIPIVAEWTQPAWRIESQFFLTSAPIVTTILGVAFIAIIARQAWSGNIRVKIITAFTIVALVSLGILGTVTYINYRNQVREDIRQRLLNMVSIAALQQDAALHATIQNPGDEELNAYKQIKAVNSAIIATEPDIAYLYTMRMDEQGHIYFVVDTGQPGDEDTAAVTEIYEDPGTLLAENFATLDHPIAEEDFYTDIWGTFLSAYAPFYAADGSREGVIGMDITADKVVAQERSVQYLILGTTAVSMVIVTLLGLWLGTIFTRPILNLSLVAQKISEGDLSARAEIETADEVGDLARIFNTTTSQLQITLQGLEHRVAERTQNLELAAEVGRSVSQVRELHLMLTDACNLILEQFDLYYVQVYLTDPSQTNLILEAGTGDVGAQLLAHAHSLTLNTGSINGRAAVEKRTVVISDTAESTVFRPNPLLPDTRGEMAVPLIVADKVVGVLDMQTTAPGKLTEEVLPAFEALAGQLAVAVQNAELLEEAEQARAEVEKQAARLVRTGWSEHLDAIHKPEQIGFVFDRKEVTPLAESEESELPEDDKAVSALIAVTGEPLGSLVVEVEDESKKEQTTELVNIVARQVAQQIENLRLLESAERYRQEAEQAARLQTIEGWQAYIASRASDSLGYVYDTKEVRPRGDGQDEDIAMTLPLKARDETVGKLAVQGLTPDDRESFELANAVAERLGAHIENLRLFEETRRGQVELDRRARQLAAVAQVSTASSQEMDVQKMLETVVHLTQRQFGLYHAHVFTYNEETEELVIVACGYREGDEHEGTHGTSVIPISQEQSLVARAGRIRQAIIVNDVLNEPGWLPNPLLPETRAELAVPLLVGDKLLGVLDVQSERLNAFTDEDANIQLTLASQVAIALQNARSFAQAQRQAEREATLNVISQKIQSATSVEAVLQIAARELGHALGAPMTIAQLSMKDQK